MKPPKNKSLPCAIFGHNYKRSQTNIDHTLELTCTQCDTVVVTDRKGNFETHTVSNVQIKSVIQELYRLKLLLYKAKAS